MKNFSGDRREGGFSRGGDRGGKPGFAKKEWSNDRPAQMHKAVCAECGRMCEVPFRPTGDKPVYCADCFNKKRDSSDSRVSRDYGAPKRDFGDRFAPRADARSERPAFKPSGDNSGKQLAEISQKLDRLIVAMEKMTKGGSRSEVAAPALPIQVIQAPNVSAHAGADQKPLPPTLAKVSKPKAARSAQAGPKKVEAKKAKPAPAKKPVAKKKK